MAERYIPARANAYAPDRISVTARRMAAADPLADMVANGEELLAETRALSAPRREVSTNTLPPTIAVDASGSRLYVQGEVFSMDDHARALETEGLLSQPAVGLPNDGGGWTPISPQAYAEFLEGIRNPSARRIAGMGWDTGVDQLKQLGGSVLRLAGAEETGTGIIERAEERIRMRSPYAREFTGVVSGEQDFTDWFAYTVGTQGPMLVESIAAAVVGAATGGASAGPIGATAGALAGVVGRRSFIRNVVASAERYRRARRANRAPNPRDVTRLRQAGAIAATVASNYAMGAGDSYLEMRDRGITEDDARARLLALAAAVPYSLAESIPEVFIAGRVLGVGGRAALPSTATLGQRAVEYGLKRPAAGIATFGTAEALTEGAQEGINMASAAMAGADPLDNDEVVHRFINSMAAGFAVGGAMGGIANLRSGSGPNEEVNMLDDDRPDDGGGPADDVPPGTQLELPFGDTEQPETPEAPRPSAWVDAETDEVQANNMRLREFNEETARQAGLYIRPYSVTRPLMFDVFWDNYRHRRNNREPVQDVLDVGVPGDPMLQDEVDRRSRGPVGTQEEVDLLGENTPTRTVWDEEQQAWVEVSATPWITSDGTGVPYTPTRTVWDEEQQAWVEVSSATLPFIDDAEVNNARYNNPDQRDLFDSGQNPSQGALQFGPAAPSGPGFGPEGPRNTQMRDQLVRAQRLREVGQAQAQRRAQEEEQAYRDQQLQIAEAAAREEAEREAAAQAQAEAQAQKEAAQQQAARSGETQPVQLPLFTNRQAPRPSRGEALRRGAQQLPADPEPQARNLSELSPNEALRVAGQMPLFTNRGEPSAAALRSAGQPVPPTRRALKKQKETEQAAAEQAAAKEEAPKSLKKKKAVKRKRKPSRILSRKAEREERARLEAELAEKKRVEKEVAAEKAAAEKAAAEKAAAEKAAAEKAAAEKAAAEKENRPGLLKQMLGDLEAAEVKKDAQEQSASKVGEGKSSRSTETDDGGSAGESATTTEEESRTEAEAESPSVRGTVEDDAEKTLDEVVDEVIAEAKAAVTRDEILQTLYEVFYQYVIARGARYTRLSKYLDTLDHSDPVYREALAAYAVIHSSDRHAIRATNNVKAKGGGSEVRTTRLYSRIEQADLVRELYGRGIDFDGLPSDIVDKYPKRVRERPKQKRTGVIARTYNRFTPVEMLAIAIRAINSNTAVRPLNQQTLTKQENATLDKLAKEYEAVREEAGDFTIGAGRVLSDYFDANGRPQWAVIGGRMRIMVAIPQEGGKGQDGRFFDVGPTEREEKVDTSLLYTPMNTIDAWERSSSGLVESDESVEPIAPDDVTDTPLSFEGKPQQKGKSLKRGRKKQEPEAEQTPKQRAEALENRNRVMRDRLKERFAEQEKNGVISRGQAKYQAELVDAVNWDELTRIEENTRDGALADSGRFYRVGSGKIIKNAMPRGAIGMVIRNFLRKLDTKPLVQVYKNQADLKKQHPELHARAVKSRPQGDFDSTPAVGFSFRDETGPVVIIFSENVQTEQQLKFVLAHETLGHFGMRSIVGAEKFNALMRKLYKENPTLRAEVDAQLNADSSMSLEEAVEEVLADYAAILDVSIIARIWHMLKNALNKFGVFFGDEGARYFISQSRRYVRHGNTSSIVNMKNIVSRLTAMESGQDPYGSGRFAPTDVAGVRDVNMAAGVATDPLAWDNFKKWGGKLDAWINRAGGEAGDKAAWFDSFVSRFFTLLTYRARENDGLSQLLGLITESRNVAMSVRIKMKERMAIVLDRGVGGWFGMPVIGGITPTQLKTINDTLYNAMFKAISQVDLSKIPFVEYFTIDQDGNLVMTDVGEIQMKQLFDLGTLTFEEMRDGYTYETITLDADGKEVVHIEKVPGVAEDKTRTEEFTKKSIEWRGYLAVREAMFEVNKDYLKSQYIAVTQERTIRYSDLSATTETGELSPESRAFIEAIREKYVALYSQHEEYDSNGLNISTRDGALEASKFLEAVNKALLLDKDPETVGDPEVTKRMGDLVDRWPEMSQKELVAAMRAYRENRGAKKENTKFALQDMVEATALSQMQLKSSTRNFNQSVAHGYVPLRRRGDKQIRVVVRTLDGNVAVLHESVKSQMVYRQFEHKSEAERMAEMMNTELFGSKNAKGEVVPNEYEMLVLNKDGGFSKQKVTMQAEAGVVIDTVAAPLGLDFNEFVEGLRHFGLTATLNPKDMRKIVTAMTKQENRARKRMLRRDSHPGHDPDAIRAVAEHIDSMAAMIGKRRVRTRISELMNLNRADSNNKWNGNKAILDEYKKRWEDLKNDPNASEGERENAMRQYYRYKFMYDNTNPEGEARRGNLYFNEGARLVHFLDNNKDVAESDIGNSKIGSRIRAWTSIMQLGGSIATGALNYMALWTNVIPSMAWRNEKNAYGGGFGFGASVAELQRAMSQVGMVKSIANTDMNTAEFYDKMVDSKGKSKEELAEAAKLRGQYGLESHEAEFIAREIREGTMIPAQGNALSDSARGYMTSALQQRFVEGMMWTFNSTERGSRRSAGLAAYRLEYNRLIASGQTKEEAAAGARDYAVDMLNTALGEYSVINRPHAWKSGVQSFLYIYKIFPTTSILLFKNLPRKGQIFMLGSLMLLSGMAGIPFAEDLEDIIDTIAQKLGLQTASVRFEFAQMLDSLIPGSSSILLNGFGSYILPGDIAGRVSLGNFVPGTGILLAGSSTGREVAEIAGPAFSMMEGTANLILNSVRMLTTEKVTLEDVFRESPVTAMRMLGDTVAYMNTGAVVDRRGYVVSEDMNAAIIAARLVGFYPAAAANEYSIIRISRRITDYQREVSGAFRYGWVKARLRGDNAQARQIEDAVRDWNRGAQGSGLEIRNFRRNANVALREARRPARARLLRSAPVAAREDLELVARLLGYDEE